jgi:predicted membrane protein
MQSGSQNRTLGVGIIIILAGLVIILHQARMLPPNVDRVLFSWQMLLVAIGVFNLFSSQSKVFGYILIAVGGFFMLPLLFTLPYNFSRNFWPVILILVGLFIIFRHGINRKNTFQPKIGDDKLDYLDEFNIFSGSDKKIAVKGFRGGRITSVFGGSEIDFREAELSSDRNVIEVFYLFGGSSIKVPSDWNVVNKVTAIFGGFTDKRKTLTPQADDPSKTLIITGTVMFGGGEIQD